MLPVLSSFRNTRYTVFTWSGRRNLGRTVPCQQDRPKWLDHFWRWSQPKAMVSSYSYTRKDRGSRAYYQSVSSLYAICLGSKVAPSFPNVSKCPWPNFVQKQRPPLLDQVDLAVVYRFCRIGSQRHCPRRNCFTWCLSWWMHQCWSPGQKMGHSMERALR